MQCERTLQVEYLVGVPDTTCLVLIGGADISLALFTMVQTSLCFFKKASASFVSIFFDEDYKFIVVNGLLRLSVILTGAGYM